MLLTVVIMTYRYPQKLAMYRLNHKFCCLPNILEMSSFSGLKNRSRYPFYENYPISFVGVGFFVSGGLLHTSFL